ncbi:MAG: recombinase family protein [Clostridia bacterium]|jgi:DNA invertase Pin-like site-specific DNA recombinase|nr:recombinase family protein [Clostridia bacterium]MCI2015818.1 recombinase family protein [Clostridia bacterium]
MEHAAIYIRVSTDEQTEYSPAAQKTEIMEYAHKNDMLVDSEHVFIDEGISGKSAKNRPAFQHMIALARSKSHPFSVILVHKFDRFARNKEDSVIYKALLKKDGVRVISVKEPIPDDDKFAVIYESMLEAMAEYYSLNLAEEVKKTMLQKAKAGEYQTAPSFGYMAKDGKLVIKEDEAKYVKYIFDQYVNNNKTILEIAKSLNAMGVKTKRKNAIENRTVQYILLNPVYIGYLRWTPSGKTRRNYKNPDTLIVKSTHAPIVSEDIFLAAREKWELNRKKNVPHRRPLTEGKHWLSGLVKCHSCGRSLIVSRNYKYGQFSLQCGGYNHGQCHVSHSITSRKLIPTVLNQLYSIATSSDVYNSFSIADTTSTECAEKIDEIKKQLSRLDLSLQKAKQAYLAGIDDLNEYRENKNMITKNKTELEAQLKKLNIQHTKDVLTDKDFRNSLLDVYEALSSATVDMETKKMIARRSIQKIVYNSETNSIRLFLFTK